MDSTVFDYFMSEKFEWAGHRSSKATSNFKRRSSQEIRGWLIGICQVSWIVQPPFYRFTTLQQFVHRKKSMYPAAVVLYVSSLFKQDHFTFFFTCEITAAMVAIFLMCWFRLAFTHWSMKASLPEVNRSTGKCFHMVRIVTKNRFFEIKISRPTPLDSLSVELFSLDQIQYDNCVNSKTS